MAKNRSTQSRSVRFIPALNATLLCLLLGGSAAGYVLQKNKLYELGRQINKREVALERLKWDNNLKAAQLAKLQMPQRVMERVKELKLGLVPSQFSQWISLAEPSSPEPTNHSIAGFVVGK